jgi:hypothetical protein
VQIIAEVPLLQTETPEVGTSLGNTQLIDLPLSFSGTRIAESFAYKVTPGVSGGSWSSHILGSTEFSKETLLDGATVTTERAGHFGESSVSVEALQEFKIQASGMSAEFARTHGGIFNYIMKSGTNQIVHDALGVRRLFQLFEPAVRVIERVAVIVRTGQRPETQLGEEWQAQCSPLVIPPHDAQFLRDVVPAAGCSTSILPRRRIASVRRRFWLRPGIHSDSHPGRRNQ